MKIQQVRLPKTDGGMIAAHVELAKPQLTPKQTWSRSHIKIGENLDLTGPTLRPRPVKLWYTLILSKMKTDQYGQMIFDEQDLVNQIMQGNRELDGYVVDPLVGLDRAVALLEHMPALVQHVDQNISVEEFDRACQQNWHMPESYQTLDIAELVLSLCDNDGELQRCGQELLLYQERDLFNLLRYLKYLVDVMNDNNVIWGVGRGSSVASYVLYKLGVHKIDSLHYDLDPTEFLR
jgi:hypothetical protein